MTVGDFEFKPDYATPPGWTLLDLLEERGMTQAELARRTDLSVKHISRLVNGHVPLSTDVALRLERVTGVTARFWLKRESIYQERRARRAEERNLEEDLDLLGELPTAEMVRLGILTKRLKPLDRLREALRFFGVANRRAWLETLGGFEASFRMSEAHDSDPAAAAVWLRMGEIEAAAVECAPWDPSAFKEALGQVRSLTQERDPRKWQPEVEGLCAAAGVAVVVLPEVKAARAHGAARWLTPGKGLIQLSIRHRWSDIFWFSFFHEAKHILDETRRAIFLSGEQKDSTEEQQADRFAQDFLIPPDRAAELPAIRTDDEAQVFADSVGVHPGIVVGRLHHEKLWPHNRGNGLRQRLEITESAKT